MPLVLRPLGDDDLRAALRNLGLTIAPAMEAKLMAAAGGSVAQAIKLVNYGGLDILEAFDGVLSASGPEQRKAMHKIADAVSARGNDTLYGFFIDHAGEHVAAAANRAAREGDIDRAYRLSNLHASITERTTVADAYNLDRKQTVISLLGDLAAAS